MHRIEPAALGLVVVSIGYPFAAAVLIRFAGPGWVVAFLVATITLRTLFNLRRGTLGAVSYGLLGVASALALVALEDQRLAARLYPVFMNVAMLLAFGYSLWRPPSMIEQFARLVEPDLPPSGVRYTRSVTRIWACFFMLNGAIAFWTALYASWNVWTVYNGFISYLAIGGLIVGEWLVRPFFRNKSAQ